MYEQGLRGDWYGSPLGDSVSLGIHESQSRMWENLVGRSEQFWEWALPVAREVFGADLGEMTVEQIHRANNVIRPSFIRVESDELTYNLHIMLRFDFERQMLNGDLAINDLPSAWNERMKADFGLTVDKDAKGCLQDVHWSMGAMGYFPTYTFGNLYSAQLWNAMGKALPKREAQMRKGEFAPILEWLRENIHQHGRRYPAEDLCEKATGERLNPQYLMDYLRAKANRVYGV
jgi:carboxypeptidase Taq